MIIDAKIEIPPNQSVDAKIETDFDDLKPEDPPDRFQWRLNSELPIFDKFLFESMWNNPDPPKLNLSSVRCRYRIAKNTTEWFQAESEGINPLTGKQGF
jgi:hypothetical protein